MRTGIKIFYLTRVSIFVCRCRTICIKFQLPLTLIHVECHRPTLKPSAERLSRHWYDLARLADHELGQQALLDTELLRDVLRIKETFYRSGFSHYDRCIAGGLRLIPDPSLLTALRQDYQAMLAAQMFYGETLVFETIVERLRELEAQINRFDYR